MPRQAGLHRNQRAQGTAQTVGAGCHVARWSVRAARSNSDRRGGIESEVNDGLADWMGEPLHSVHDRAHPKRWQVTLRPGPTSFSSGSRSVQIGFLCGKRVWKGQVLQLLALLFDEKASRVACGDCVVAGTAPAAVSSMGRTREVRRRHWLYSRSFAANRDLNGYQKEFGSQWLPAPESNRQRTHPALEEYA